MTHTTRAPMCFRTLRLELMISVALGLVSSACLVDTNKPCGDNEVLHEVTFVCMCLPGYALSQDGCVKCGKNEIVQGNGCVCGPGYTKSGADARCIEVDEPEPADAGGDTTSPPPTEPTRLSPEGEGSSCQTDEQCSAFPDATDCDDFFFVCSIKNCSLDPNNCPDGYACCDVSVFAPGAPNVCIRDACPVF